MEWTASKHQDVRLKPQGGQDSAQQQQHAQDGQDEEVLARVTNNLRSVRINFEWEVPGFAQASAGRLCETAGNSDQLEDDFE